MPHWLVYFFYSEEVLQFSITYILCILIIYVRLKSLYGGMSQFQEILVGIERLFYTTLISFNGVYHTQLLSPFEPRVHLVVYKIVRNWTLDWTGALKWAIFNITVHKEANHSIYNGILYEQFLYIFICTIMVCGRWINRLNVQLLVSLVSKLL